MGYQLSNIHPGGSEKPINRVGSLKFTIMKRLVLFTIFCQMILSCSFEDSITLNLDECNHPTTINLKENRLR